MAGDLRDKLALERIRLDLEELNESGDPEFEQECLTALVDVSRLGSGDLDSSYDKAIERAFGFALSAQEEIRQDLRAYQDALSVLAGPDDQERPRYLYRGWPLATAYLEVSFSARHGSTWEMLHHAELACRQADEISSGSKPPGVVADLRARAHCERANALRVAERFKESEVALDQAIGHLAYGSGDIALSARLRDVESSLRNAQRRLPEALDLFDETIRLYRECGDLHLAGRTLVKRAYTVYLLGDPAEAAKILEEAMPLLDRGRDPGLITNAHLNMVVCLADSGDYRRAGELLLESGLHQALAGQPLNLLRLRWVEAKIHAGMDRLDRAATIYEEVRAGFLQHDLHYVAALAGLDLAVVWLRQGKARRLLPLMLEICLSFNRLELPTQEALLAVTMLKHACRLGVATVGAVQKTRDFLARVQAEPDLKFDAESVFGSSAP